MRTFVAALVAGSLFVSLEDIKENPNKQLAIICWDEVCRKYQVSKPATKEEMQQIVEDTDKE